MLAQHLIALGHIEIDGRRDFFQVADGLCDRAGRGRAIVDVKRAAIVENNSEIVVAARSVVPGQPVDHDRRFVLQEGKRMRNHHLVAGQHAMRIDHGLGHAGRAGCEQELGHGIAGH